MKTIFSTCVPNIGPEDAKICVIGEAPGEEEESHRDENGKHDPQPFVGRAGEKLNNCLTRNGAPRESVWIGNLSNYRPLGNNFEHLLNSQQLTDGLHNLHETLKRIKPNVIVPLGAWPLFFLTGKYGKKPGTGIMHWRGSIINCILDGLEDVKCISALHPAFVARNAKAYPIFDTDIKRIVEDAEFPELRHPKRDLIINPSAAELAGLVNALLGSEALAVDIETFGKTIACVGFASSKSMGVCIPWGDSQVNRDAIKQLLASGVPKVCHFGFFDTEKCNLEGLPINNWHWDTYVAQHVMWPELPNTLAYLTSIYTREPYYKAEGKEVYSDQKIWSSRVAKDQLWLYNCKDVCVTYEIFERQKKEIQEVPEWGKFLEFEMEISRGALSSLSRAGMLVDINRRTIFKVSLLKAWVKHQLNLNKIARQPLSNRVLNIPETDVPQWCNAQSNPQCALLFYGMLGFNPRRKRDGSVTCDEDAIISMIAEAKKEYDSKVRPEAKEKWLRAMIALKLVWVIRGIRKKLSSYIKVKMSNDGRYRSSYKVGPETGRWAAEKWIDGTGVNLMTIPRGGVEVETEDD